jgi:hypothetical protein
VRIIKIENCRECPHFGHSGGFDRGGPKPMCEHPDAKTHRRLSRRPLSEMRTISIPGWCPLMTVQELEEPHEVERSAELA